MKIELKKIKVKDLYNGYTNGENPLYYKDGRTTNNRDEDDEATYAYGGILALKPAYQREFVYDEKERNAVIDTVLKGFPLSIMYWCVNSDNTLEVLDGRQRSVSICEYIAGNYSVFDTNGNPMFYYSLSQETKDKINNYELLVYFCEGTDDEKLKWFNVVNVAGKTLTAQELLNATYYGSWTTDAKRKFSKTNGVAYKLASDYMKGAPIRQEYLETVINWIASREDKDIKEYMAEHKNDEDATKLWEYFEKVISWVKVTFPNYRKEMKGIEWGLLYNKYGKNEYSPSELEKEIEKLYEDDDVTKKSGIFEYVLQDKDHKQEKLLSIRAFTNSQKATAYARQKGICPKCGKHFEFKDMEGDHITPHSLGGKTVIENLQMLCKNCNRTKSDN